jgi:O-succinylbenzoate synthase
LSEFKGNNFAKAALEIAWWNLQSSISGKPLHALLGGSVRDVPVGEALGITSSLDELLGRIQKAFDIGYTRIKLKVRPDRDIDMLNEVRRAFPKGRFHIDGNCGYSIDDMPMFEKLDRLNLVMIEQPLGYGDLLEHAKLQRAIETPICLDESCVSVAATRAAIELGSCKIINIKPPRVGGLANSIRILDVCRQANIPCWVGSMLETSLGTASNLAFASLPGIDLPCDAFPSKRFYAEEITERELDLSGPGTMRPLDVPSSAHAPLPSRLNARVVSHARLAG